MFACLRSGKAVAKACEECRRGREKLFNHSETSKHVERLVGEVFSPLEAELQSEN